MYRRGMYRVHPLPLPRPTHTCTHTHPVRAPSPQLPYTESIGGLSDVKFAPPDCIHMRRFGRGFKAAEQQEEKGDRETHRLWFMDRQEKGAMEGRGRAQLV